MIYNLEKENKDGAANQPHVIVGLTKMLKSSAGEERKKFSNVGHSCKYPWNQKFSYLFSGSLLIFCSSLCLTFVGDSLYGKVTAIKSATMMTFDYGEGKYEITLIGIDIPEKAADEAKKFVTEMVLEKNTRMRFEGRTPNGEMMVRLFTDEENSSIKEVAVELVKSGLARRKKGFDFKYGELTLAEREARKIKIGIWQSNK